MISPFGHKRNAPKALINYYITILLSLVYWFNLVTNNHKLISGDRATNELSKKEGKPHN